MNLEVGYRSRNYARKPTQFPESHIDRKSLSALARSAPFVGRTKDDEQSMNSSTDFLFRFPRPKDMVEVEVEDKAPAALVVGSVVRRQMDETLISATWDFGEDLRPMMPP
ncbi:hypothetical protein BHM03_00029964 [Ensete ventricosum]|uniref:Uncharacterized protein n=1 Tax=Ensete ventricosum TaxID=4639 RepID=A0A445MIA1_ENSVE|nr:hypothetical protein BHM03_00029964 [Ensete ventricosum]